MTWSDGFPTAPRTDPNVTANVNVTARFAINTYTLTYTAGANGTIVGTAPQTVNHGANGIAGHGDADPGLPLRDLERRLPDGGAHGPNVTANISVTAIFAINTYTLTYTAGANGSIVGTAPQTVNSRRQRHAGDGDARSPATTS